eukprot:Pgem_evm1s2788
MVKNLMAQQIHQTPKKISNEYRICLLGGGGVGKSAMTVQWTKNQFDSDYDPTIENSFIKQVSLDGDPCKVDILDTAGQEEYKTLQSQHLVSRDAFIIVYAVNSHDSFREARELLIEIERIKLNEEYYIILV